MFRPLMFVLIAAIGCGCRPAVGAVRYQPGAVDGAPTAWNFDLDAVGSPAGDLQVFNGTWAVRAESDAPSPPHALCQTGVTEFPAVSIGPGVYGDVVLSARFKAIAGVQDRAAGLLVRMQDANNYYILRANALEQNVNLYIYAAGRRSPLREGRAAVPAGQWQDLRFEAIGSRLRGFLNGTMVVEATDGTYPAGQVGLWTKADSVTCFDDVEVRSPDAQ